MSTSPTSFMVGDRYRAMECIGEGGSALVFRAQDGAGRDVAVKMLKPAFARDDTPDRVRFQREIDALARLDHPRVVGLLDHGHDAARGPYLITPFLDGETVRARFGKTRLEPEAAFLLWAALLDGVAAIHSIGLVHRDLKPENVMLTRSGGLMIVDFGLAYHEDATRCTVEGAIAGSVPYMAPEQIDGGVITPASDVWSCAVMLYELIAGARPFQRSRGAEEAAAILAGSFEPLDRVDARVSRAIAELIATCLSRDAGARPRDASVLRTMFLDRVESIDPQDLDGDLSALLEDEDHVRARLRGSRIAALRIDAEAAIARGDSFAAIRALDRALAYDPNDGAVLALLATAAALPVDGARAPERVVAASPVAARASRRARLVSTIAVLAGLSAGALVVVQRASPAQRSEMLATHGPLAQIPMLPENALRDAIPLAGLLEGRADRPLVDPETLGADPSAVLAAVASLSERERGPAQAVAHAAALLALDRRGDGLAALDAQISRVDASPAALRLAISVRERQAQWALALSLAERVLAVHPGDSFARRERGLLRLRAGDSARAYADLVAAVRAQPDDRRALMALAMLYAGARRADAAQRLVALARQR